MRITPSPGFMAARTEHSRFSKRDQTPSAAAPATPRGTVGRSKGGVIALAGSRRRRRDWRLRPEHLLQRIAGAEFFTTRSTAHTDRANHLIVDNDRITALLRIQSELLHPPLCRQIFKGPRGDDARWFARKQRGSGLLFRGALIEIALPIHAMLMDDAPGHIENDDSGCRIFLTREILTGVGQ